MGKLESYRDLAVWKEARSLVQNVYGLSKGFPKDEQFGLTNQLRRAAVSIPSNIAEGCGRNHFKDSIQLFFITRGRLYEVETQMLIGFDLKYLSDSDLNERMEQVKLSKKLLNGFINCFQKQSTVNPPSTVSEQIVEYSINFESPSTNNYQLSTNK